jgi:hypothetical protein
MIVERGKSTPGGRCRDLSTGGGVENSDFTHCQSELIDFTTKSECWNRRMYPFQREQV